MLISTQQCEIDKQEAADRVTVSLNKYYIEKYPHLPLTETNVRKLRTIIEKK